MTDEANAAALFPTDPGFIGTQSQELSLVLAPTPEVMDDVGFSSIPRSMPDEARTSGSTQLGSRAQAGPGVLDHFIGGANSRDAETRAVNAKIGTLEKARSELLVETAALMRTVESLELETKALKDEIIVLAKTRSELQALNAALVAAADTRDAETRTLNEKIVALEKTQSDLLRENAAFMGAVDSSDATSKLLKDKVVSLEKTRTDLLAENTALIAAVNARDTEFRALNEKIAALEKAQSDLHSDNTALLQAVESGVSKTRTLNDEILTIEKARSDLLEEKAALIATVNARDAETRSLNERIASLEESRSEVLFENAALASALAAANLVAATAPPVLDKEDVASVSRSFQNAPSNDVSTPLLSPDPVTPAVLDDFPESIGSTDTETSHPGNGVVVFAPGRPGSLVQNAVLASASNASKRNRNFAKLLIALGGSLAGFGFHLLGSPIDSRETGFAVMTIGASLGLLNFGWFLRPQGE